MNASDAIVAETSVAGAPGAFVSLAAAARAVLETADPSAKAHLAIDVAAAWRADGMAKTGEAGAPAAPARPARPELRPPGRTARRRAGGSRSNRIALLHALAHIELNAIDLAFDLIARFAAPSLPRAFYDDWCAVGGEEARHFLLLTERLSALGAAYGDLPAHDGLWQAAAATADDLLARLAIVPMVLEARGLDVTPTMIARMKRFGDEASARVLEVIHADEIGHVATGLRWFEWAASARGLDPASAWHRLVRERFTGGLKPPFNAEARALAGFDAAYLAPWTDAPATTDT